MKAEEEMMERDQDYAGGRGEMMGRALPSITITNGCSKCPKSAGPERCQYCSPENFCCVPEHGNSYSCVTDKVMCVLNVLLIIFVETQNTGTQKMIQLIKVRVENVLTIISTMYQTNK